MVNKKWGVPKSTLKRLVKENGIDSEFEIFADGIKRSYKAVAIEDFLASVYEYRPIFSTDIFGWAKVEKTDTSKVSFQRFKRRNFQIYLFSASNSSWWNKQAKQTIPWLQQVCIIFQVIRSSEPFNNLFSPFLYMARNLRKVHHFILTAIIEKYEIKLKNSRDNYCAQYVR